MNLSFSAREIAVESGNGSQVLCREEQSTVVEKIAVRVLEIYVSGEEQVQIVRGV